MLDIRRIRTEPEVVKAAIARRGDGIEPIDRVIELDTRQRGLGAERDDTRARINAISKQVGALRRDGKVSEAEELQAESRRLGEHEKTLSAEVDRISGQVREILLTVGNMPADECPDGDNEHDNVITRVEGYDPESYQEHQKVAHWDIGAQLGILDVDRAVRMSGAMFVMYRGMGARLVRGLINYALDRNRDAYEEVRPPTVVKTETMISTGHLPKFIDDAYHLERDDLWAIPTAEVPLTSIGRDEVFDEAELPLKFMAHTSCFRREAGSAGRDTRGLLRVHEFDKVELLSYATPEQSAAVHADILERAESAIRDLGLAYRILDLCTGDLGNSSARTFDIETYAPGADRWLEVSSVSWFSDYQARRANIRYRPTEGKGTRVLNTLNGSGLAVPRVWASLVETHRQPDGSIHIPEALQPYMGGLTEIPASN